MGKIKEFQLNVDNELQELYERIGFNNVPVNHQQILTYVCLKIMDSNNINHWINNYTDIRYDHTNKLEFIRLENRRTVDVTLAFKCWVEESKNIVDDNLISNFTDLEIRNFKEKYEISNGDITNFINSSYINDKTEYGYIRKDKKWISIYSQNFSKREQAIANYLRNSINCSIKKFYK